MNYLKAIFFLILSVSFFDTVEGIDFVGKGEETYFWTNDSENFNYHLSNGWF